MSLEIIGVEDLFALADTENAAVRNFAIWRLCVSSETTRVFEAALTHYQNGSERLRLVAVEVLACLSIEDDASAERRVDALIDILAIDKNEQIIDALLRFIRRQETLPTHALLKYQDHPSPKVRLAVVQGLRDLEDTRVERALLRLIRDCDADVRDWAALGIGAQSDADTPEIREALFEALSDEHLGVQYEAIMGLAKRNDSRVRPLIVEMLEEIPVLEDALEFAAEYGDSSLLPYLMNVTPRKGEDASFNEALAYAIECCSGIEPTKGL